VRVSSTHPSRGRIRRKHGPLGAKQDICAGGAYFYTSHPLVEGTEVKLDIVLEVVRFKELTGHFPAIKVNGTVLRAEVSGMAIGFDKDYKILAV
jgi:hypothetical protein